MKTSGNVLGSPNGFITSGATGYPFSCTFDRSQSQAHSRKSKVLPNGYEGENSKDQFLLVGA